MSDDQVSELEWKTDNPELAEWLRFNGFIPGCDIFEVLREFINVKYKISVPYSREDVVQAIEMMFRPVTSADLNRHKIIGMNRASLIQIYLRDSFEFLS